jgi:sn-glycerol 3-phosphate transport system permease protein
LRKKVIFNGVALPYLLLLPQLAITAVFFFWPAGQAIYGSFLREDAFGLSRNFVGLENFYDVLSDPNYIGVVWNTAIFSGSVAISALAVALFLAVQADKAIRGANAYKTLLIWPYAVAPAIAGVLWLFLFQPSLGIVAKWLRQAGVDWNPLLRSDQAMALVVLAATWKQISYNFLFFLAGLQAIPRGVMEAAAIDGARPARRFWTITFPLLSPTAFFLLVINVVYVFFDTFGIIDTITQGGPSKATETLVYKVYVDGKLGSNLGGSAAQSVILLAIVMVLTAVQFRYIERKVTY